jgi:chromosomal replication initiator protein
VSTIKDYFSRVFVSLKQIMIQHDKNLKILIGVVGQPQTKKQHTTPLLDDYTFENLVLGNANQKTNNDILSFCLSSRG